MFAAEDQGAVAWRVIRDDIARGRLVPLLEDANPSDEEAFQAVFIGRSASLPARAQELFDFLAEHGQVA